VNAVVARVTEGLMSPRWHRTSGRRGQIEGRQLVRETESFLAGRYAADLQRRGLPVPEWAWLSALIHTPAEQLTEVAGRQKARWRPYRARWQSAFELLASELLTTAGRNRCSVEDLQHSLLVKFELGTRTRQHSWPTNPDRLVHEVRLALANFRDSPRL
jgi:hypothetical protein